MPSMVDYDTAQALLAAALHDLTPVRGERIPVSEAAGRVLAQDVYAVTARPEADISAMDGYAFHSEEMQKAGQAGLPVVGYVAAGDCPAALLHGTASIILTGARIPEGADCVVAREYTVLQQNHVTLTKPVTGKGLNIRRKGEEFSPGKRLLRRGQGLDWRHMPLLLSQGMTDVEVYRPVTVSILANGAEFGEQAGDGRTELNTHMLAAMMRSGTVHVTRLVAASDSKEELREALVRYLGQSDVIVTTGGISVGDTDHVLAVLLEMGASCVFRRVSMRPGKPVTVMRLGGKIVFCLPGNPGAAAFCAQLFVLPCLRALSRASGTPENIWPVRGRSAFTYTAPAQATCFLPVSIAQKPGEGAFFNLVPSVGASDISCLTHADGLVQIDAGQSLEIGQECDMLPFTGI
ncbi:molybdopterin molybdotransferase MoeA [Acetobacter sp.]|uniref:molybdopterin molybdotransferase MoeA n=1 Tax=Acetobacter sp. TaxID=440 RepID=UPI0025C6B352|nr:molybdopterin molybdotransferase MoeA [Acetobacter sp.]MCH4092339.1 molybdopterin molybdotransferase MoeA [Acetobacter sp.]MCI1300985.1 molybdopterin molybdotransferase MoeA [Acetobacter sp.]MCI1317243.1 molybdopterin molybdotransferase MoeA [Acetobacter sp.]